MSIKEQYFRYLDHIGSSVTMRELAQQPDNPNMIALRHDIDHDIDLALEMAHYEYERGIRATYFLLHTNEYWDDARFLLKCRQLQEYGHEIGLHLNVLTQWMHGEIDDVDNHIRELLTHLRSSGLEIVGTSAHGDTACYTHRFINYWLWKELRSNDPTSTEGEMSAEGIKVDDANWQVQYPADHQIIRDDKSKLKLWQSSLRAHGLTYDAVHVPHTNYWSDTGGKWTRTGDPLEEDLKTGRHQILVHPHWWRDKKRIIFALSTARSGSKWLANFVENATSFRGLHEWTLNNKRVPDGYEHDKRTSDDFMELVESQHIAAALIRQALAHHRAIVRGDVLEANVYIQPFLDYIKAEEPNVEFIHLHRDAKDVVRSILNRGWYDTPIDRRHFAVPNLQWDKLNQFERACWYVRWTQETAIKATNSRISFEKMVSDLGYITEVLRELGIIVHPLLAQEEFAKHIDPNRNTSMPPFEQWDKQYKSAFGQICGEVQQELGYEIDKDAQAKHLKDIEIKSDCNESIVEPILQMDLAANNDPLVSAVHTNCITTNTGLSITTIDDKHSNAHVLLCRGKWAKVKQDDGCESESNVYYSVQLNFKVDPGMTVRVFLLLYCKRGRQIFKRQLAVLRSGSEQLNLSFTTHPDANHFALGLLLGFASPEHQFVLSKVLVNAVTLSDNYHVRYNIKSTEILEPVVNQSAIDPMWGQIKMALKSMRAQLAIAVQKFRMFCDIFFWMLADLKRNAKRLSFIIISFSIASVITRLGILGLLMIFVKAQTEDKPIIVRGYEIPSDTSLSTLALWGGCVLLLAVATGLITYSAEALTFKLARGAMERTSDRAITVIAAGQSRSLPLWSNGGMKMTSRKAMMSDSMMLMRSVLRLGRLPVPLITFCIFSIILLWLNSKLTLFLLPAIVIYTIPFYMLNRGVAIASRDYEQRRQVRSRTFQKILDFASQTQYPGILRPSWADHFQSDPSAHDAIDSFREIILSKRKMAMLQDILYGVILCVLLIVFGSFLAADKVAWVDLLFYLVALRFVMGGMSILATLVIALNRFAPQIKRLKEFITIDIPTASTLPEKDITKPLCIKAIEPKLDGSMNSASPQVGEVIACIGAVDVDSYHVSNFCKKLMGNSKQSRCLVQDIVYCGDVQYIPQLRICELITGQIKPDSTYIKQAESALKRMSVLSEIQNLHKGMDTVLCKSVVEGLSPICRYAICLSSALICSRKYVVLDWKPLARLQEAERKRILDALSDRVVVLVSLNGQGPLVSVASLVVVMDETAVRGIGDQLWYNQFSESATGKKEFMSVLGDIQDDEDDLDFDD